MEHWNLYHPSIPPFLLAAAHSPEMLRLRDVGMNCGCEYTSFPRFQGLAPYSRWDHSLGVGLIVWHFTRDAAQALAGLLHDIATPVFAHVVDFLRGDYLTQESTEDGTREIIARSTALRGVLQSLSLTVDDVCDYHRYPIADNETPRLSADRLEYTLGNCLNYGIRDAAAVRAFYADLTIDTNEDGAPELAFRSPETAADFARAALACSEIYVADADRYAMQTLAELLALALARGVIEEETLCGTESAVIERLISDSETGAAWRRFCALRVMERSETPGSADWRQIFAKKRCIDPLAAGRGRVSALSSAFARQLAQFQSKDLGYWIHGHA